MDIENTQIKGDNEKLLVASSTNEENKAKFVELFSEKIAKIKVGADGKAVDPSQQANLGKFQRILSKLTGGEIKDNSLAREQATSAVEAGMLKRGYTEIIDEDGQNVAINGEKTQYADNLEVPLVELKKIASQLDSPFDYAGTWVKTGLRSETYQNGNIVTYPAITDVTFQPNLLSEKVRAALFGGNTNFPTFNTVKIDFLESKIPIINTKINELENLLKDKEQTLKSKQTKDKKFFGRIRNLFSDPQSRHANETNELKQTETEFQDLTKFRDSLSSFLRFVKAHDDFYKDNLNDIKNATNKRGVSQEEFLKGLTTDKPVLLIDSIPFEYTSSKTTASQAEAMANRRYNDIINRDYEVRSSQKTTPDSLPQSLGVRVNNFSGGENHIVDYDHVPNNEQKTNDQEVVNPIPFASSRR